MLTGHYTGYEVTVTWPQTLVPFLLEHKISLSDRDWIPVPDSVLLLGEQNQVTVAAEIANDFFRLRSP